jgi:hypothetical protein
MTLPSWVSGALEASWRAVFGILILSHWQLLLKFFDTWGICHEFLDESSDRGRNADLLLKLDYACLPQLFDG